MHRLRLQGRVLCAVAAGEEQGSGSSTWPTLTTGARFPPVWPPFLYRQRQALGAAAGRGGPMSNVHVPACVMPPKETGLEPTLHSRGPSTAQHRSPPCLHSHATDQFLCCLAVEGDGHPGISVKGELKTVQSLLLPILLHGAVSIFFVPAPRRAG